MNTCAFCGTDMSAYGEDDIVFLRGDTRPYCSHECVVCRYRENLLPYRGEGVHRQDAG